MSESVAYILGAILEILFFIVGLFGIVSGNLTFNKNLPIKGRGARVAGLFLALPLPLAFLIPLFVPPLLLISIIAALGCVFVTTENREARSSLFWLASGVPAFALLALHEWIYLSIPVFFWSMSRDTFLPSTIQSMLPEIVEGLPIPILAAFIISLIIPVAKNRLNAFLFALPVFVLNLYYYSISDWIIPGVAEIRFPGDTPGAGYQSVINGLQQIPVSLFLFLFVAIAGWIGTRLRTRKQLAA